MTRVMARDCAHLHDGCEMVARVFAPEAAPPRPGILVVHGARGLDDFILLRAEALAAAGYTVLAVDLWGGRTLLDDPAEIGRRLGAFARDRDLWMGRLAAACDVLAEQEGFDGRMRAIGFCFGGASALEMLRTGQDLAGAVSLHAGLDLIADDWSRATAGKALVCTGAADPLAPPGQLARITAAMTTAGIDWQVHVHGGALHGFTEPDGPGRPPLARYDARADRRSWSAMLGFLAETFTTDKAT